MKKKILIPTDFSKNAWNALSYAIELYKNETCDFYLLNTFNASGYALDGMMVPEPGEKIYDELKKESEKGLGKVLERLTFRDQSDQHKFFAVSQFNSLVEGIKNIVEKQDIDLIVMGTKGSTNAEGIIFGSNTVLVIEKSRDCPVLAVPENALFNELKEIVFPTDYEMSFKRRELSPLVNIAKLSNASIRILHVSNGQELSKNQENNKKLLQDNFETVDHTFHLLTSIEPQSAVRCFSESRESDMVAFFNRKHSFFGSIFSRPMVKSLGRYLKVPMLALHDIRS